MIILFPMSGALAVINHDQWVNLGNLFARKAYVYAKGGKPGEYEEIDIPDEERAAFDRYYQELIEAISATDDALLERYLEGVEIGRDEAITGMKEAMKREDLFPLFCVSSESMIGVRALLTETP